MTDKKMYDRIESYLLGKLSQKDRALFEAELQTNQQLADELSSLEMEHKMMEALIEEDLRSDLIKWNTAKDKDNDPLSTPRKYKTWFNLLVILIVAAVILILAFILMRTNVNNGGSPVKADPEKINQGELMAVTEDQDTITDKNTAGDSPKEDVAELEQGEEKGPTIIEIKNAESSSISYSALADSYEEEVSFSAPKRDEQSSLDKALAALTKGQFDVGKYALNAMIAQDSTNLNAIYYLGLAHYHQKQFVQAVPLLEIISQKVYLHSERAQWILSLAYLQNEKLVPAEQLIKQIISDSDHPYYDKAKDLLSELNALQ